MPGSFNPGDYIDFHDNPFEVNYDLPDPWQGQDREAPWSSGNLPELDLEGVEWFNYGPPAVLSKAPNVTSEILQNLIQTSIETVRAAAQEEKRRREEEKTEKERRTSAEQAPKPGDGEEPYLPIIIPVEKPVEKPLPTPPPEPDFAGSDIRPSDEYSPSNLRRAEALKVARSRSPGSIRSAVSSEKVGKLKLRRILGWSSEKGDGNAERKTRGGVARKLLAGSSSPHANYVFAIYQPDAKTSASSVKPVVKVETEVPKPPTPEPVETAQVTVITPDRRPILTVYSECVSCLDDFPLIETIKVPCHTYCPDCFTGLISVSVQNEQQWPPKCCLNEIPYRTIFKYVPEELKERFKDRSVEWSTPVDQRVYCYEANCGSWIKPERINTAEQLGRCDSGHKTCVMCRGKSHGSKACERDTNLSLTQQLAEEQGWKKCGKCKAYVEHATACRHMTCRCGYQFCYVCGERWCTCHCTGHQLAVIKNQAFKRAKDRRDRELAEAEQLRREAEDLRLALAQIAEFEREEARKAEMLREEQERLERERQQRELEERVRKETVRRADLEAKFSELRNGLDLLHDLQVVMLETQQEDAASQLAEEMRQAKQQIEEIQQQELLALEAEFVAKMEIKGKGFEQEYLQRSAAEKSMIKKYKEQLETFYANHPNASLEIDNALLPLVQRMDANQKAYNKWMNEELEKYEARLKERHQIKEEYRYSAKARLQDAQDQKEMELVKRTVAENRWMQMVVLERERILGTLEGDEIEGDADSLFGALEVEVAGTAP